MDIELIRKKEQALIDVGEKLKQDFVGLDDQIDKIVKNVKIWYIMPDLLTRPTIINLWGMTGTGKTDLVRKFSTYLKMADKLVEIQMDTSAKSGWSYSNSVKGALYGSDIEDGEQGIILFDEFQRFRTINEDGTEKKQDKFTDIWMLLSDGKFNSGEESRRSEIVETIHFEESLIRDSKKKEEKRLNDLKKGKKPNDDDDDDDEDFWAEDDEDTSVPYHERKLSFYKAKTLKKVLRLKDSVIDLCKLNNTQVLELYKNNIDNQDIYQGGDFSKTLIFICGNLDDVYSMSRDVADADSDADILHKFSLQLNIVNIKNCLSRMFKPEQVARLGNSHVIYPCLSRDSYKKIICKTLNWYVRKIDEDHNFELSYSDYIVEELYKNFVYPSQGVRPVFSGINSFLSEVIPPQMFYNFEKYPDYDNRSIHLDVEYLGKRKSKVNLFSVINGDRYDFDYDFDLAKVRKNISKDKQFMFAVHEVGHAFTYALLFKQAPKIVNIELTSFDGAYVLPDKVIQTKTNIDKLVQVYYAGLVAEEIVFGKENRSDGCESDIFKATETVVNMVRKSGMVDRFVGAVGEQAEFEDAWMGNVEDTNAHIHDILNINKGRVQELIKENIDFFIKFVDHVYEHKKLNSVKMYEFLKDYIPDIKYSDPLDLESADEGVYLNFAELYQEFKKNPKKYIDKDLPF